MYVSTAGWITWWVFLIGLYVFTAIAERKEERDDNR